MSARLTQKEKQSSEQKSAEVTGNDVKHGECEECHVRRRLWRLAAEGCVTAALIIVFYAGWLPGVWSAGLLLVAYAALGWDVIWGAMRNIAHGRVFDERFLMAIATTGAIVIGAFAEAAAVMLLYQIGEALQDKAVGKSRREIRAMLEIRPDMARVMREGAPKEVPPREVEIGEIFVVRPGERVPMDGVVRAGASFLDMKALTGESALKRVRKGDYVMSGVVNTEEALTIEATHRYEESTATKIVELVEKMGHHKAKAEEFITIFARYYTPIVVAMAAALAVIPPLACGGDGLEWLKWLNRGLVFLVISCPCALVISVPLAYFGGIGAASRRGILVKGGNYLEALNKVRTLVFDKTGTLTRGTFEAREIRPAEGVTREEVLEAAAKAEAMSNHPIAASILCAMRELKGDSSEIQNSEIKYPENNTREDIYPPDQTPDANGRHTEMSGRGVRYENGQEVILAGNARFMQESGICHEPCEETGTLVYVSKNGIYLGCIVISDEVKPDSASAIARLRSHGISRIAMLSGDVEDVARRVASQLKMDACYFELLPAEKVDVFQKISSENSRHGKTAFVGDGMNDAPVLACADVGIAMGGIGSDAAIEAADIVLMTDESEKIPQIFEIARQTKRVVVENIAFALSMKILFLGLGAFGLIGMWHAVFADVGVMILAVLNALRLLRGERN